MEDGKLHGRRVCRGKKRCIDYTALAQSFIKWECEKQLSVHDVSSLWGKVCEDMNWPNTKKNRLHLRTIWFTNRRNIHELIVKEKKTQENAVGILQTSDSSTNVTKQDSQLKRELRVNPAKKIFSQYKELKPKKIRYCLCQSKFSPLHSAHMVQCSHCKEWYHTNKCLGLGELLEHVTGKTVKFHCGLLGCQTEPMLIINKVDKTSELKKSIESNALLKTDDAKIDCQKDAPAEDLHHKCPFPGSSDKKFHSVVAKRYTPSSLKHLSIKGKPQLSSSTLRPSFSSPSPSPLPLAEHDYDNSLKKVPEQFTISLSAEDWSSIQPQPGVYHLVNNWSDKLREACKKENPYCVLVFKQNHIRRGSYKFNAPYFHGKAVCKFTGCATYHFKTKADPKPGKDIVINVIREGELKHMKLFLSYF